MAEKRLKNMFIDKENDHEQQLIELKRLINAEKKKAKEIQDLQYQNDFMKNQEDLQDKDHRLVQLN